MIKVLKPIMTLIAAGILMIPANEGSAADESRTLSLNDCIDRALSENLNLQSFNLNLQSMELSIDQAESIFDPSISLSLNRDESVSPNYFTYYNVNSIESSSNRLNLSLGQNLEYGSNWGFGLYNTLSESNIETEKNYTSNLGIRLSQPLLKGFGKKVNRSNIYFAGLMTETAKDNLEMNAIDLIYNVQRTYWDLVFARQTLKVREISLTQADSLLAYNEKGLSLGILTESDVLEARSQVVNRQKEILDQKNVIKNNEDVLRRLLNMTSSEDLTFDIVTTDAPEVLSVDFDEETVYRNALRLRPDYKIAMRSIAQNELNIAIADNSMLPSLDINAQYTLNSAGTTISKDLKDLGNTDTYGWQLGLTLSYPLKNRSAKADYQRQQIELKRAQLALEDLESQIRTEVRAGIRNINTAREQIEVARMSVEVNELKLKMEEERFINKLSTSYYVLLFQSDLATARNLYNSALVDYTMAVVELQRASGMLLEQMNISIVSSN